MTETSDSENISIRTLGYYNQHAESFRAETRDHDVRQNIEALALDCCGQLAEALRF